MRSSLRLLAGVVVIGVMVCLPRQSVAQVAISGVAAGNQAFTGTLGQLFTVTGTVNVSTLGAFDDASNGFFAGTTINVAILDSLGAPVTSTTFTNASPGAALPGAGSFKFKNVPTVNLSAGSYTLVAWGFNSSDLNFNSGGAATPFTLNTFGGRVAYGLATYNLNPNSTPNVTEGPAGRFGFASFANVAPEPATFALFSLGMVAGVIARRRRA